jgi:hypothetical protein
VRLASQRRRQPTINDDLELVAMAAPSPSAPPPSDVRKSDSVLYYPGKGAEFAALVTDVVAGDRVHIVAFPTLSMPIHGSNVMHRSDWDKLGDADKPGVAHWDWPFR